MSYDTIRAGLKTRLTGLGYAEADDITDFSNVPQSKYGKSFILRVDAGEMDEESSNTIITKFYDFQTWSVSLAFDKSSHSEKVNYDEMQRAREAIIKDLDDPPNWTGFAKIIKYRSWEIQETPNYFVLIIRFLILDQLNYT